MCDPRLLTSVVELVRKIGKVAPTVLITENSQFIEELGIDSLDLVSLFIACQDQFGVEIDENELLEIRSIGHLCHLLDRGRDVAAA